MSVLSQQKHRHVDAERSIGDRNLQNNAVDGSHLVARGDRRTQLLLGGIRRSRMVRQKNRLRTIHREALRQPPAKLQIIQEPSAISVSSHFGGICKRALYTSCSPNGPFLWLTSDDESRSSHYLYHKSVQNAILCPLFVLGFFTFPIEIVHNFSGSVLLKSDKTRTKIRFIAQSRKIFLCKKSFFGKLVEIDRKFSQKNIDI